MGLDATVYRSLAHVPAEIPRAALEIDPDTGEVYPREPEDPSVRHLPRGFFIARTERLGNISLIIHLRENIEAEFGHRTPIVLQRVVYSGSHSGDTLPLSLVESLAEEIALLQTSRKPYVVQFAAAMAGLVAAAKAEGNPIVFV